MLHTYSTSSILPNFNCLNNLNANFHTILKADSGATQHYLKQEDSVILENYTKINNGPTVSLPNNTTIQATHRGTLPLPSAISTAAMTAHTFPHLKNTSLLSIGQLCDDDCVAVLDKHKMGIYKNKKLILSGPRNKTDGLWDVKFNKKSSLPSPTTSYTTHDLNVVIAKNKTMHDLANFLHACAGSPTLGTFQKAIDNGNFITWPNINNINLKKYKPNEIATAKGHLDQERKNLQSTKKNNSFYKQFILKYFFFLEENLLLFTVTI